MGITLRTTKGSKLTIQEMDGNFTYLDETTTSVKPVIKTIDPTPSDNISTGYPLNKHWVNSTSGDEFIHKTDGVWVKILTNDILSTSLTETVEGKAADATVIKILNDSKYPKLQNGSGYSMNAQVVETLVSIGFDLSNANLFYANLDDTNLSGANLSYAYLFGANLSNANLNVANLSYANLSYANLSNANLNVANLSNANLNVANLSYVTLFYVNLSNANLSNANLSYATGLNSNINIALADINKDPNFFEIWTLTWTDDNIYSCDPSTGLFTLVP